MLRFLHERDRGTVHPALFRLAETTRETFAIDLSMRKRFRRQHRQGVLALDLDPVDGRFLLSTGGDGHVFLYDTDNAADNDLTVTTYAIEAIRGTPTTPRLKHQAAGSGVRWFPWDTGIFTTSSFDKSIKAWDTNTFRPVVAFDLGSRVFTHAFSPVATTHCLLAAGCQDPAVRLCDVRSGASAHSLIGHQSSVQAIAWSPTCPFVLASGSADKNVRLWDIRGAGRSQCLMTLDQHNVSKAAGSFVARTGSTSTAHDGTVNGLVFLPDGFHLLSTGTDNHVRHWSILDGINTLVNYEGCTNASQQTVYFCTSQRSDPTLVYHPHNNNHISVCHQWEGNEITRLRGHFDTVNVIIYHHFKEEVISGSNDGQILAWTPLLDSCVPTTNAQHTHTVAATTPHTRALPPTTIEEQIRRAKTDHWSDSEDEA